MLNALVVLLVVVVESHGIGSIHIVYFNKIKNPFLNNINPQVGNWKNKCEVKKLQVHAE